MPKKGVFSEFTEWQKGWYANDYGKCGSCEKDDVKLMDMFEAEIPTCYKCYILLFHSRNYTEDYDEDYKNYYTLLNNELDKEMKNG